jgi:hypothetical protein
LIETIEKTYGKPRGRTALYDTLGLAFEEATRLSENNPGRYIAVMQYTDGEDTDSKNWNEEQLVSTFQRLVERNGNVYYFKTMLDSKMGDPLPPIGQAGAPKISISTPLRSSLPVVLPNAVLVPESQLRLDWGISDKAAQLLRGRDIAFKFRSEGQSVIAAEFIPTRFKDGRGEVSVQYKVKNPEALDAKKEYRGHLVPTYPSFPQHVVQGPPKIPVLFQAEKTPLILARRPKDGEAFPVGKPVTFYLSTIQDADVLWDFGNGESAVGRSVQYTYLSPGDYEVSVRVESDPRIGASTDRFKIQIVDVGIILEPLSRTPYAGEPNRYRARTRGTAERHAWIVDGTSYAGQGRSDGFAGTEIDLELNAGRHTIQARAFFELTTAQTDEIVVNVDLEPQVRITAPQDRSHWIFGDPIKCRGKAGGAVQIIRWRVMERESQSVLHELERPVDGEVGEFEFTVEEQSGVSNVIVEAWGMVDSIQESRWPVDTKSVHLKSLERGLALLEPTASQVLRPGREVDFLVKVVGRDVDQIRWWMKNAETGESISLPTPVSVQVDAGRGAARWKYALPREIGSCSANLFIEAIMGQGLRQPEPLKERLRYSFSAIEIIAPEGVLHPFDVCSFSLTSYDGVSNLTWRFPYEESSRLQQPPFTIEKYGPHRVVCEAMMFGGEVHQDQIEFEVVPKDELQAVLEVERNSILSSEYTVTDKSIGDVARRRWTVDGVGQGSEDSEILAVLDGYGRHVIGLTVISPEYTDGRNAAEDSAEKIVVLRNWPVTILLWFLSLLAAGVALRYFCGNQPVAWHLKYGKKIERMVPMVSLKKYWSRWYKEARIPFEDVDLKPIGDLVVNRRRGTGKKKEGFMRTSSPNDEIRADCIRSSSDLVKLYLVTDARFLSKIGDAPELTYFELLMNRKLRIWDVIFSVGSVAGLLAFNLWLWFRI